MLIFYPMQMSKSSNLAFHLAKSSADFPGLWRVGDFTLPGWQVSLPWFLGCWYDIETCRSESKDSELLTIAVARVPASICTDSWRPNSHKVTQREPDDTFIYPGLHYKRGTLRLREKNLLSWALSLLVLCPGIKRLHCTNSIHETRVN